MAPRRKCPVCGSRQWHKEPSSGLVTCSEGHVLQNYRNETTEVTELGPHHMRKRTLRSQRKKEERHTNADPKLYHGERARYHYFQCLQLILRMQITALARLWQLPPEFEQVCRDVWALHLSLLPKPPVAEPLLHMKDTGADEAPTADNPVNEEERDGDNDSGSSSSSSSSGSEEESDHDSELDRLMRENSETPSSDDEAQGESRKDRSAHVSKKKPTFKRFDYDEPAGTVSVLALACWTLRVPVIYMDFVKLIESYDLPYLDALRLLPENMVRHLRKHTAQTLSPQYPPTPLHLHSLTSRLAKLMYSKFDIYTPELNAPSILWRAVRVLQGSPTLYVMTKKLARVMSIPLTLHRILAPELIRKKKRDPSFHKHDSTVPEVALVATVIVVMKMVYGLDGKSRRPRDKIDPACALPALPELIRAIQDAEATDLKHAPAYSLETSRSALDMDDKMLDEYLAFCERALLPREDRMPPRNATTDQFPLSRPSRPSTPTGPNGPEQPTEQIGFLGVNMAANTIDAQSNVLRPGEQYTIYNTQDILGSLPNDMDLVISRAAKWAGVDDAFVSNVVERFERRVVRWWDNAKRREREKRAASSE
ncbi:hypothetical protein L226DRAFT_453418 [Lentinus tigrinus ALCF2SS1-7]|uniref:RRN7-type domain-containing protein n=1 Tax=Lentinus tigrinus ALCF2SS1-6 TaxID=1328759 RepID=A0A5C2SVT9_9APHY|nr:hypothetical protein L227DRAFT_491407 [Lentinus tigrinus ALCF2SS1-6]RPD81128.1 hypothetical protein L226DRAFT_453418 [Lentinus tigrinus ALCF2SS1-7]